MPTSNAVLLPQNVQPVSYAIHLSPNLKAFTFEGEETVAVRILASTNAIVLNAAELQVHAASFNDSKGQPTPANDIDNSFVILKIRIHMPRSGYGYPR